MRTKTVGYGVAVLLADDRLDRARPQRVDLGRDYFATIVLQAATLVAAVRTADVRGGTRLAALVAILVVVAAAIGWAISGDVPATPAAIVNGLLVGVAPVAIARGLLRDLREQQRDRLDARRRARPVYLLAGMFFSFLYGVVGAIDPDRLFNHVADGTREDQLYFSFVTLCTVGCTET